MNNIKFKIIRYSDYNLEGIPGKIIGFNVVREDDDTISAYHETILRGDQFIGKTTEECIDTAFAVLSSSMAITAAKLLGEQEVVGSYYIPN